MTATSKPESSAWGAESSAKRFVWLMVVLLVLLIALGVASLFIGAGSLSDTELAQVFLSLRGMRLAAACLVGAGLAVAGCMMQGLFRNPLADPGILGTSAGAMLGGMIGVTVHHFGYLAGTIPVIVLLPLASVLGALMSLWMVMAIARRANDNLTVLLAGVVLSLFLASFGAMISSWAQDDWELARSLVAFSFGTIDAKGIEHLSLALPLVLGGVIAAWYWSREMDALLTGEEEAASLGIDIKRTRRWLMIWSTLPVAGAVAIGGSIAFVGLVVPHLLRGILGPRNDRLVPVSALGGAFFVLFCDVLARLLPTQSSLPISVLSGLIGAPIFVYLLMNTRRQAGF